MESEFILDDGKWEKKLISIVINLLLLQLQLFLCLYTYFPPIAMLIHIFYFFWISMLPYIFFLIDIFLLQKTWSLILDNMSMFFFIVTWLSIDNYREYVSKTMSTTKLVKMNFVFMLRRKKKRILVIKGRLWDKSLSPPIILNSRTRIKVKWNSSGC